MFGVQYKASKTLLPVVFTTRTKAYEYIKNQTNSDSLEMTRLDVDPAPQVRLRWVPTENGSVAMGQHEWRIVKDNEFLLTMDNADRGSYKTFWEAAAVAEGLESK